MKRFFLSFLLAILASGLFAQNEQCDFYIQSSFDSECILTLYEKDKPQLEQEQNDCLLACAGSTVSYKVMGASSGFSYTWDVAGASNYTVSSGGAIITVDWPDALTIGQLVLTATSADDYVCLKEVCVELIEKPVAEISSNPMHAGFNTNGHKFIEVCDGQEIQFYSDATSSADAPIVGYLWEDGANNYSTENFTFTADFGTYGDLTKVVLTVTNECGCEDRMYYIVHISKYPTLKVDCYGTACEGDEVTYTAVDQSCDEFLWSVDGGVIMAGQNTPSITVDWNDIQDGYGYLALDGEHCNQEMCPSLTYLPIPVIQNEVSIEGPTVVCKGEIFSFKLPLWASTEYTWSFTPSAGVTMYSSGHPHELLVEFSNLGNHTINCSYNNEFLSCSGVALPLNIEVKEPAVINSENEVCKGESITFETNITPSNPTTWTVYDDNMTLLNTYTTYILNIPFNQDGSFTIIAENNEFCSVIQKSIIVHALPTIPTPDVTSWKTEVCANSGYVFDAVPAEEMYYLHWEASCGTPDAYDGPEFNVTLGDPICNIYLMHVDQLTGCMSAPYEHILSDFTPDAIAWNIPTPVCANSTFIVEITPEDDVLYEWSIGAPQMASVVEGQYSTTITVQTNAASGIFDLELERSFCNTSQIDPVSVEIGAYVIPEFTLPSEICQDEVLTLSPTNGQAVQGIWTWTIDGTPHPYTGLGANANYNHTFENPGTIAVSLSYDNGCNQVYETVHTIIVNPKPIAELSYVISGSTLDLNAVIQGGDVGNLSFNWLSMPAPNTNSYITTSNPSVTTTYKCEITNTTTGCSSIAQVTIFVVQDPPCSVPGGAVTGSVVCAEGTFLRSGNSGPITWTIGGNTATVTKEVTGTNNVNMDAIFHTPGFYTIVASEYYSNCSHVAYKDVVVPLVPEIMINYSCTTNNQLALELINSSAYIDGVYGMTHEWSIGASTVNSPIVKSNGIYLIHLKVKYYYENIQYECHTEKEVVVARGIASISLPNEPYCSGTPIGFHDGSTNPIAWQWTFGNPNQQNLSQSPDQTFENTSGGIALVPIILTIQDALGCSSTDNEMISINANPYANEDLTAEQGPFCSGEEWKLTFSTGTTSNTDYTWYDVNQVTSINEFDFTQTGSYYVIIDNQSLGCIHQSNFQNICFENTPFANISGNDNYCRYDELQLFGQTGDYAYQWFIDATPVSTSANLDLPLTTYGDGAHTVDLFVSNANCSTSTSHDIFIHAAVNAPNITFGNNRCIHEPPVNLKNQASYPLYWNTGDFASAIGTYTEGFHTAYYIDPASGCKSAYADILVAKAPDFNELMTGCYEFCKQDLSKWILGPMGDFGPWQWQYNTTTTVDNGTGVIPDLEVPAYGSYDLTVEYTSNCVTTSDNLEIFEKENCDSCDIQIDSRRLPKCWIENCELFFEFPFEIFNLSSSYPASLIDISASNATIINPSGTINIAPGGAVSPVMEIILNSFEPPFVNFEFTFVQNGVTCTRFWTFDFTEHMFDCVKECGDLKLLQPQFHDGMSIPALSYYEFGVNLGTGYQNVQIFSDEVTITSTTYNSNGTLTGLFSITPLEVQALIDNNEEICFSVYACKDNNICHYSICMLASKYFNAAMQAQNRSTEDGFSETNSINISKDFSVFPNPAQSSLHIMSQNAELKQYEIMNITGQAMQIGSESIIDIDALAPGTYLIKLIDQTEAIQYLKFIKE